MEVVKRFVSKGYLLPFNKAFFILSSTTSRREPEEKFLRRIILTGMTVYDVGAHIGTKTVFFAKNVGSMGKVVAFEPNPVSFSHLLSNVAQHRLSNVTAINLGLGSKNREVTLTATEYSTATGSLHPRERQEMLKRGKVQQWTVQVRRLDDLNFPPPDLIKIDVEGYEYEVLEGMSKLIAACKPMVFIELHGVDIAMAKETGDKIITLLTSAGYKLFHIESGQRISLKHGPRTGHIFAFFPAKSNS
jgi:FkbM family methyltransferase